MESLIHNKNLPLPLYSSNILFHRDKPSWRAKALIGIDQGGKLSIWNEYQEDFSEQFELVNRFEDIKEGYDKALRLLISRGYIVEDENRLSEDEIKSLNSQFLKQSAF